MFERHKVQDDARKHQITECVLKRKHDSEVRRFSVAGCMVMHQVSPWELDWEGCICFCPVGRPCVLNHYFIKSEINLTPHKCGCLYACEFVVSSCQSIILLKHCWNVKHCKIFLFSNNYNQPLFIQVKLKQLEH